MEHKTGMNSGPIVWTLIGWLFGLAVFTAGILNVWLVHPVPGIAYLLFSLIFLPPANAYFRKMFGFRIPALIKIVLGLAIFFFTLGVSDLGDMIDKL